MRRTLLKSTARRSISKELISHQSCSQMMELVDKSTYLVQVKYFMIHNHYIISKIIIDLDCKIPDANFDETSSMKRTHSIRDLERV